MCCGLKATEAGACRSPMKSSRSSPNTTRCLVRNLGDSVPDSSFLQPQPRLLQSRQGSCSTGSGTRPGCPEVAVATSRIHTPSSTILLTPTSNDGWQKAPTSTRCCPTSPDIWGTLHWIAPITTSTHTGFHGWLRSPHPRWPRRISRGGIRMKNTTPQAVPDFWGYARNYLHQFLPQARNLGPRSIEAYRISLESYIHYLVALYQAAKALKAPATPRKLNRPGFCAVFY